MKAGDRKWNVYLVSNYLTSEASLFVLNKLTTCLDNVDRFFDLFVGSLRILNLECPQLLCFYLSYKRVSWRNLLLSEAPDQVRIATDPQWGTKFRGFKWKLIKNVTIVEVLIKMSMKFNEVGFLMKHLTVHQIRSTSEWVRSIVNFVDVCAL